MGKRNLIIAICLCVSLLAFAKGIKLNYKAQVKPYNVKIEKVEFKSGKALLYGKIKQQNRFSYSVDFSDCYLTAPSRSSAVKGELVEWNDNKKITNFTKTISDQNNEEFIISFPAADFPESGQMDLHLGTILDRNKTPLLIEAIPLHKK